MLDEDAINSSFRTELAKLIAPFSAPTLKPLRISPWVAMSLTQKAIRRGEIGLGLQAAATLLLSDPGRLWRRLGAIAFEDIGMADRCAVGLATVALAGKRIRADLGGEWTVASWLVHRLCKAPKSRMTDDLLMACQARPALQSARDQFASLSHDQLRRVILNTDCQFERAIAMIYLAGTDSRMVAGFHPRRGEPALAFHVADELGASPTVLAISKAGYRKTREALCLLLPLIEVAEERSTPTFGDDILPPAAMAGPVPGWALDTYTREGKEALRRFLGSKCSASEWINNALPQAKRLPFLSLLTFHGEGGLLIKRYQSALAGQLRQINEEEASGIEPEAMQEALAFFGADIPQLNVIRAQVMGSKTNG